MKNLNTTQNLSMVWILALLNSFWPWIVLGIVKQRSSITNKFSRFETTGRKCKYVTNWQHISTLDVLTKQNETLNLALLMLSDSQAVQER